MVYCMYIVCVYIMYKNRTCKQAVGGETPYNALDKLLSLIALPCKYRWGVAATD